MKLCKCNNIELIDGPDADTYSNQHLQEIAHHGGWVQLWKCSNEDIYWEGTWVGGGGFDNGKFTLRKITSLELEKNWPEIFR